MELQAGQNIALAGEVFRFRVAADMAVDLAALIVGHDLQVAGPVDCVSAAQPQAPGVVLASEPAALTVRPAEVRSDAQAVLLITSVDTAVARGAAEPTEITASLDGTDDQVARFVITPAAGETALICFEVYRRGPSWKLRALGQGYAGGRSELLFAHGGQDYADRFRSASVPTAGQAEPASLEVGHGLQRLWMVFEDAARSAAALNSARNYAAQRLDQELSAAVSDPATRNTPAAESARAQAQRNYDELTAAAESDHRRDSEQLRNELVEAEQVLPPSLASWESPAWDRLPIAADGIRLGELYAIDRGPLRIPYCVPVPLNRPLWIDTQPSSSVAPVVGALLARLLAAAPHSRAVVDIIDLSGAFAGLIQHLAPVLGGPPVTDISDVSPRLQSLVDAAELAEMAHSNGAGTAPTENRILLVADFPHGYQGADAHRLATLITRGALLGLSTIFVGANESDSEDNTVAALSEASRHLPTIAGTPMFDPWTDNAWELDLDLLPQEPELQARFLRAS